MAALTNGSSATGETCPFCGSKDGSETIFCTSECNSCKKTVRELVLKNKPVYIKVARDSVCSMNFEASSEPQDKKDSGGETENFKGKISADVGNDLWMAFATSTVEAIPFLSLTSQEIPGDLAEMVRFLEDVGRTTDNDLQSVTQERIKMYFLILDIAALLKVGQDIIDGAHSMLSFPEVNSLLLTNRGRALEPLAVGFVAQAARNANQPLTIQEITKVIEVFQKEVNKSSKSVTDVAEGKEYMAIFISSHLDRLKDSLRLSKRCYDLSLVTSDVVVKKGLCPRRNPASIAAAAVYYACMTLDLKKTQTEICKASELTEVTLRKVHREISENRAHLLPTAENPGPLPFPYNLAKPVKTVAEPEDANLEHPNEAPGAEENEDIVVVYPSPEPKAPDSAEKKVKIGEKGVTKSPSAPPVAPNIVQNVANDVTKTPPPPPPPPSLHGQLAEEPQKSASKTPGKRPRVAKVKEPSTAYRGPPANTPQNLFAIQQLNGLMAATQQHLTPSQQMAVAQQCLQFGMWPPPNPLETVTFMRALASCVPNIQGIPRPQNGRGGGGGQNQPQQVSMMENGRRNIIGQQANNQNPMLFNALPMNMASYQNYRNSNPFVSGVTQMQTLNGNSTQPSLGRGRGGLSDQSGRGRRK